jgi:hypothetical protein
MHIDIGIPVSALEETDIKIRVGKLENFARLHFEGDWLIVNAPASTLKCRPHIENGKIVLRDLHVSGLFWLNRSKIIKETEKIFVPNSSITISSDLSGWNASSTNIITVPVPIRTKTGTQARILQIENAEVSIKDHIISFELKMRLEDSFACVSGTLGIKTEHSRGTIILAVGISLPIAAEIKIELFPWIKDNQLTVDIPEICIPGVLLSQEHIQEFVQSEINNNLQNILSAGKIEVTGVTVDSNISVEGKRDNIHFAMKFTNHSLEFQAVFKNHPLIPACVLTGNFVLVPKAQHTI